jgi:quercetin dioxygenase-like cupin family protein
MKITSYKQIPVNNETCCTKTAVRQLMAAEGFDIKFFEMQPGGYSPQHSHPEQHQILVISGAGTVSDGKKTKPIQSGDIISILADEPHQLKTTGDTPLRFLAVTFGGKE